jgi:hypothetical protein
MPIIPRIPLKAPGAGIGNLKNEKTTPQTKPVNKDKIDISIVVSL